MHSTRQAATWQQLTLKPTLRKDFIVVRTTCQLSTVQLKKLGRNKLLGFSMQLPAHKHYNASTEQPFLLFNTHFSKRKMSVSCYQVYHTNKAVAEYEGAQIRAGGIQGMAWARGEGSARGEEG